VNKEQLPAALQAQIGQLLGSSEWFTMDQERITGFGHLTADPDPMHIDSAWAKKHSPYGNTIAFGFLTISMLTAMNHSVIDYDREERSGESGFALNYGFDKLRLLSPVPVGSRIRGHFKMHSVTERDPGEYLIKLDVEVEIEGQERPALAAEWLSLWVASLDNQRIANRE